MWGGTQAVRPQHSASSLKSPSGTQVVSVLPPSPRRGLPLQAATGPPIVPQWGRELCLLIPVPQSQVLGLSGAPGGKEAGRDGGRAAQHPSGLAASLPSTLKLSRTNHMAQDSMANLLSTCCPCYLLLMHTFYLLQVPKSPRAGTESPTTPAQHLALYYLHTDIAASFP